MPIGDSHPPAGPTPETDARANVSPMLEPDAARRAEKISRIAAAVQSGTYPVDSPAVSRAIVDDALSGGDSGQ
jgi:anti-sigma28 factor (negative regulator of flagellin synthesis)